MGHHCHHLCFGIAHSDPTPPRTAQSDYSGIILGVVVTVDKLVSSILNGLDEPYRSFVGHMDLKLEPITFENLHSLLLSEELQLHRHQMLLRRFSFPTSLAAPLLVVDWRVAEAAEAGAVVTLRPHDLIPLTLICLFTGIITRMGFLNSGLQVQVQLCVIIVVEEGILGLLLLIHHILDPSPPARHPT
ncbi:hypothetical protein LINGRAHAP2_LOCUS6730 [Linum grandiflorum]